MSLFDHIEALHGGAPWGRFLDAGTGVNSGLWSTSLSSLAVGLVFRLRLQPLIAPDHA
ncbi:hypothetical protein D3C71_1420260 [compost metagenome]